MAVYSQASNDNKTRKLWELENEKLYRDAAMESYFLPRFGGTGKDSMVTINNKFQKEAGDNITFAIRMRLQGGGVGPGGTMEGNEDSLTFYDYNLTLTRERKAVRIERGLTGQRTQTDLEEEARAALRDWMAERIDYRILEALDVTPSLTFYNNNGAPAYNATYATAKAAIADGTSKLTPKLLSYIKTGASTGWNRSQTPIRPIKVNGKDHYIFLAHPDAIYDLRQDSEWNEAQREANVRGSDNPIFNGMVGMWDNIVVHSHERVTIGTDAGVGANVPYSKGYFLGAQAVCWANGKRDEMVQETFDYEEEVGFQIAMTYGVKKPVFNSKDYGSVAVVLNRTRVSDAA